MAFDQWPRTVLGAKMSIVHVQPVVLIKCGRVSYLWLLPEGLRLPFTNIVGVLDFLLLLLLLRYAAGPILVLTQRDFRCTADL